MITNDGFLKCIILYNALCTMHAGETMHCKPCYNSWPVCLEGLLLSPLSVCSSISEHIEAETKWPPFRRWHFQVYFLELKLLIFSCDQAALRTLISVRLSVCLSVCLSHLFDNVPVIVSSWNYRELLPLTDVMSMQNVKVRGQRSRSQRSWPHLAISGP